MAIVFTDLLKGVLIGIALGIFYIIRSNFRTSVFIINDKNHYLIRLRKDISFFSKPVLKNKLESLPVNCSLLIDLTRAEFIDKDVIDRINEFVQHAHLKKIQVSFKKSTYNPLHELVQISAVDKPMDDMAH